MVSSLRLWMRRSTVGFGAALGLIFVTAAPSGAAFPEDTDFVATVDGGFIQAGGTFPLGAPSVPCNPDSVASTINGHIGPFVDGAAEITEVSTSLAPGALLELSETDAACARIVALAQGGGSAEVTDGVAQLTFDPVTVDVEIFGVGWLAGFFPEGCHVGPIPIGGLVGALEEAGPPNIADLSAEGFVIPAATEQDCGAAAGIINDALTDRTDPDNPVPPPHDLTGLALELSVDWQTP